MTTRLLPVAEWSRLAGTLLETVWPTLNRAEDLVVVVEDDGVIVSAFTLVRAWHLEGVWIAPERRKSLSVTRRVWQAIRAAVQTVHASEVLMMTVDAESRRLALRIGEATHLDCDHFAVRI